MKRILRGFTLAELLMTLAIAGIIASLTLPSLMVNIEKQQVGPALAKAISNLENAAKMAIQDNGVITLDQIADGEEQVLFEKILKPYMSISKTTVTNKHYKFDRVTPMTDTGYVTSKAADKENQSKDLTPDEFITKDRIGYMSVTSTPTVRSSAFSKTKYGGKYYVVYVDINGNSKRPNSVGRDIFYIYFDNKGIAIPYGSSLWAEYWNFTAPSWKNSCKNNAIPVTDLFSCTGSVVDNGYRVMYKY